MSDRWTRGFKRALKGDLDPLDWKGINPRTHEIRNRETERSRRAEQMEFEMNNPLLAAAGGSVDAPTEQIKSLRRKTAFKSLTPFNADPIMAAVSLPIEHHREKGKSKSRAAKLKLANEQHAKDAQFAHNNIFRQTTGILGAKRS